jgi:hypothetical protein
MDVSNYRNVRLSAVVSFRQDLYGAFRTGFLSPPCLRFHVGWNVSVRDEGVPVVFTQLDEFWKGQSA